MWYQVVVILREYEIQQLFYQNFHEYDRKQIYFFLLEHRSNDQMFHHPSISFCNKPTIDLKAQW